MLYCRRSIFLRFILLIFIAVGLTSCIEIKQGININKDGSGDARLEVAVMEMWASQAIQELKSDLKGWDVVEEKAKEGKQIVVFGRKFKDISELNDKETKYTFSSERKGFLKKLYSLEVKQLKSSDMPFPYEVTINMPGGIDETDGTKVSSGKVKWNLQGYKRGTKLTVKSSAFAMPDFASLKEAFNKAFNKMFYREAIVFFRDDNIWVMDSDGKNQRQLTEEAVSYVSISGDGMNIVYAIWNDNNKKGNCYYLRLSNFKTTKLTDDADNCLSAEVSPDGEKVALVKIDERFSNTEAQELVSKGYNPYYVKEGSPKKTGVYIFDFKTGEQKKLLANYHPICRAMLYLVS